MAYFNFSREVDSVYLGQRFITVVQKMIRTYYNSRASINIDLTNLLI